MRKIPQEDEDSSEDTEIINYEFKRVKILINKV